MTKEFKSVKVNEVNPNYWKVKSAELEFQLAKQQLAQQLNVQMQQEFNQRYEKLLEPLIKRRETVWNEAGLDPTKNWVLNDTNQTITERTE